MKIFNFELESKLDLHFDVKFDGECDAPPRAGLAFFIEILAPLRPRLLIWFLATSSLKVGQ